MEEEKRKRPKIHPTCNALNLRTGAKLVALTDMVFGVVGIIWFVVVLEKFGVISLDPFEKLGAPDENISLSNVEPVKNVHNATGSPLEAKLSKNHKTISLALTVFYTTVNLVTFIILLIGAHQKSITKCLVWFYIRCAIFVFKAIIYAMYIISGRPLFSQIPFIIAMVFHLYGLWLVNYYVNELQNERRQEKFNQQIIINNVNQEEEDAPNGIEKWIERRKGFDAESNHGFTSDETK